MKANEVQPDIPFMRQQGAVPYHLRPSTPEEAVQHLRMLRAAEARRQVSTPDRESPIT